MIRRFLFTTAVILTTSGLCGGYFYHTHDIESKGRSAFVCKSIEISVQDSAVNRIITSAQIRNVIGERYIGCLIDSIDLNGIEETVSSLGEVLSSEVYSTTDKLIIKVVPRTAFVRFITNGGHSYYCDKTGYLFPVMSTVNVPVVTGEIPLHVGKNYKGYTGDESECIWIRKVLYLTSFIENDGYWSSMVSHLHVEKNGDLVVCPLAGNVRFILGGINDISDKFDRMEMWYKSIYPLERAANYREVSLKYDNQIICR